MAAGTSRKLDNFRLQFAIFPSASQQESVEFPKSGFFFFFFGT